MIQSMTGYGKVITESNDKRYTFEIRSLNSKQTEINSRLPFFLRDKDIEIRNEISRALNRGKIDINIDFESFTGIEAPVVNKAVVENYYNQLQSIAGQLDIPFNQDILQTIMRLPETLKKERVEIDEKEWLIIKNGLLQTIEEVIKFRIQEGLILAKDIEEKNKNILILLDSITPFEKQRIETVRTKLDKNIQENLNNKSYDRDRFEQELIYYLEKLDITEEKVRLKNHCNYFSETMKNEELSGKKLGFIAQEMTREINTIGSKANDYNIQTIVVQMKDEVEKIKEQLSNIL
jgi:uncharacterized protein (TIGR00255 family)